MCALKRGSLKVKCLAQAHNALTRPGLKPRPLDAESSALTIRLLRLRDSDENQSFLGHSSFLRLREFVFLLLCGPIGSLFVCIFIFIDQIGCCDHYGFSFSTLDQNKLHNN